VLGGPAEFGRELGSDEVTGYKTAVGRSPVPSRQPAQLQPAGGAGQVPFGERFGGSRLLRRSHRAIADGQDVDVAATRVEPAEHGGAVQVNACQLRAEYYCHGRCDV
jgi:hypothetical protein